MAVPCLMIENDHPFIRNMEFNNAKLEETIKTQQKEIERLKEIIKQLDYNHVEKRTIDIKVEYDLTGPEYKNTKLSDPEHVEEYLYKDLLDWFVDDEGFEKLTVKCTDITDGKEFIFEEKI